MSVEEAARRLADELVQGEGVHQLSTLNPTKVRVLTVIHYLNRPCTQEDLTVALGWTSQYVYRMANELADQGVLIRGPGPRAHRNGRYPFLYHCVCMTTQEGPDA